MRLALAAFAAAVAVLIFVPGSTTRFFGAPVVAAIALGRPLRVVRGFAPFLLLLLGYEWLRTQAHQINPNPFFRPQIIADRVIGLGEVPTVRLQDWFWTGHRTLFDETLIVVHSLHLAVVLFVLFAVLVRSGRAYVSSAIAFLLTGYAAVVGFVVFPAAPPWLASERYLPHVERIREVGEHLVKASGATKAFDDNPVAAIPSLHAGFAMMVVLVVRQHFPRAFPFAVAYAILQEFAVCYLGEHYVVDLLLGNVLAVAMFALTKRSGDRDQLFARKLGLEPVEQVAVLKQERRSG